MATSVDRENKEAYLLVQFKYADPETFVRFSTSNGTMYSGDDAYSPNPAMKVTLKPTTGSLDSDSAKASTVEVYLEDHELFRNASMSLPHAPIEVEIRQLLISKDEDPYESILFKGSVLSSVRNKVGKAKRVTFNISPSKARLDIPIGMPCLSGCNWIFGGRGCERAREFQDIQVTDIQGSVLTLASPLVVSGDEYKYTLGSAELSGLILSIRDVKDSTVTLRQQPPSSWLTEVITFGTGCDKSINTCRLWNNEERFTGLGISMIDYNPLYENPG